MHRVESFITHTNGRKFAVQPIFITTKGLADGIYSKQIMFDVTLNDLFEII